MKRKVVHNIIFIFLELIATIMHIINTHGISFSYYTIDSNLFALIISIIYTYYLLNKKPISKALNILRLSSVGGLMLTFLVVMFILLPMYNFNFIIMYTKSNLYWHLLCPVLLLIIYLKDDLKAKLTKNDLLITYIPTVLYATILVILNIIHIIEGPYPFLYVYKQPVVVSILWFIIILSLSYTINKTLYNCKSKITK